MKRPLQALLIAQNPKMRLDILTGEKSITIRQGLRDYQPGPVMICCHLDPWCVRAEITDVVHSLLSSVPPEDLASDGYSDVNHAVSDLRRYYPDITGDTAVTVIKWTNVQGKLVELIGSV